MLSIPSVVLVYDLVAFIPEARPAAARRAHRARDAGAGGPARGTRWSCISRATERDLVERFPARGRQDHA